MTEKEKKEIVDFLENQVKTGENMTGSSYSVWVFKNRLQKALKLIENSIPKEAIREEIERNQRAISDSNDGNLIHDLRRENKILKEILGE